MIKNSLTIAKKEITDAVRSRILWGATLALVLMASSATISMYLKAPVPGSFGDVSANITLHLFRFTPIIALLVGYKAVVGERESGSIQFLLGNPTTRAEIMLGKIIGRSMVFGISLVTAVSMLVAENLALYGGVGILELVVHTSFLLIYGVVWVNMGIGVSAAVYSRFQAVATVFGIYAITHFFWQRNILPIIAYIFTGNASTTGLKPVGMASDPQWYLYVQRLNLVKTYQASRGVLTEVLNYQSSNVDAAVTHPMNIHPNIFGIGVLLLWAIVPLLIGYQRFAHAELG